jgi:hypothetical protein
MSVIAKKGIPGIPLTALPLNPTVQGGGFCTVSGFPVETGLAHQRYKKPPITYYRLEDCKSGE